MTAWIDLSGVSLAEGDKLTWLQAMPKGKKKHPVFGILDFSAKRLQKFADNVNNKVRRIDPVLDYEHGTDPAKGKKAAGWIKGAEVRSDGLYIGVQLTDEARKEIRKGHYRYLSPEFANEWEDEDGNVFKDVINAAAITNRPFLKSLPELSIAASDDFIATLREPETDEETEIVQLSTDDELFLAIMLGEGTNYWDLSFIQDMISTKHRAIETAAGELRSGNDEAVKAIARETIRIEREGVNKFLDWILDWDGSTQTRPLY